MTNVKEQILELVTKFVINNLGNSWILHECLNRLHNDDIDIDLIHNRLARASKHINEYVSMGNKISDFLMEKDYENARKFMNEFSITCSLVGSARDTSFELEIDNLKWEEEDRQMMEKI